MTPERQRHLEAGLNRLKSMLSDMMENVRSSIQKAIDALDRLDGDLARTVIENDEVIDDLQRKWIRKSAITLADFNLWQKTSGMF
jgi:phosphate transport system protein